MSQHGAGRKGSKGTRSRIPEIGVLRKSVMGRRLILNSFLLPSLRSGTTYTTWFADLATDGAADIPKTSGTSHSTIPHTFPLIFLFHGVTGAARKLLFFRARLRASRPPSATEIQTKLNKHTYSRKEEREGGKPPPILAAWEGKKFQSFSWLTPSLKKEGWVEEKKREVSVEL